MAKTIQDSINEMTVFIKNNVSYNKNIKAFNLSTLITGDVWSSIIRDYKDVLIEIKNEAYQD